MSRPPTPDEIKNIRKLVKAAGGKRELERWISLACPPKRTGRPRGSSKYADYDDKVLSVAELLSLHTKGGKRVSLSEAIRMILETPAGPKTPEGLEPLYWTKDKGTDIPHTVSRVLGKAHKEQVALDSLTKAERQRLMDDFVNWFCSLDAKLQARLVPVVAKSFSILVAQLQKLIRPN